jgi:pSer/pThr/pTyr-binding forkhead associated (FHA) protein
MEPAAHSPSPRRLGTPPAPAGELVVQNGRLRGTRRPLNMPLTFIGRGDGCDIRLDAGNINPLHCLLLHGPSGLLLRDLQSTTGTFVNGERVQARTVRDGDLVAVGPFQLRVRLPAAETAGVSATDPVEPTPSAAASLPAESSPGEKDALRIQAAAVAAQQAALVDEEDRLHQRRAGLEQQEGQLAAHLEDKRRRLVQLREEAQAARVALQKERTDYQDSVARTRRDLTEAQKEVLEARDQAQIERKRLIEVRRRLKRRWHRHWMAERSHMRQRENELVAARHTLEKDGERLQQERAELTQMRLRSNGETELGKRQLQDEWDKLRREQQAWREHRDQEQAELAQRARALARGETAVAQAERALAYDCHQWQGMRLLLEREAEGLDVRIANQRRKIREQQEEISQLEAVLRGLRPPGSVSLPVLVPVTIVPAPAPAPEASNADCRLQTEKDESAICNLQSAICNSSQVAPSPEEDRLASREAQLTEAETVLQRRVRALEQLAGELADQRLQVAEQWARLAQTQHRWQQDHDSATSELEALAARLPEQERTLIAHRQRLEATASDIQQRHAELAHLRESLEAWQSRVRVRETTWEAERDRLLTELHGREAMTEQLQTTLVELRQRWSRRRQQELEQVGNERAACAQLRKDWTALREEWWRRHTTLEEQRRALAEKELALERFRQETLTGTEDAAAAERRVERLRRRWVRQNAATVRATTEGRRKLQAEVMQLEGHYSVLQKQAETLTQREASLTEQQAALEHREALACVLEIRAREQMQRLQAQRDRYEQQSGDLQNEVERIAHVLLAEPGDAIVPVSQAA